MPRSTPPRTVTLLLPSIPSSSSSSSTTAMSARQTPEVDFEVLIHTQKLAAESGQFFDIMSFMTPAQQKRYLTSLAPYQPLPQSTSIPNSVPVPPDPTPKRPAGVVPESGIVLEPGQPAIPPIVIPPLESPTLPPPKKPRPQPDLSHLHWKQRQKRLAMIASGEIGEDSDLFIEKDREGPGTSLGISQHGKKGEIDREAIQSSASYWNHLLVQARKSRGPQWDYNTQIYQIDRSSSDHYTHMSKPHSNTEFKVDPAEEGVRRGTANGHEHQTPGASSSSGPGDSGRAMRTPSTGNLGATPRSSVEVNGSQSQGRLPAHLQSMGQGQGYTPSLPISHLSQHQSHQHHQSQQPQHQHQSQLQQAQLQTQFQTTRLPHQSPPLQPQMYQNPQQARINPAQLAQLQLAQMGGLNPAMLQMARNAGSGGGGPGQNVNPASMGGINLASLSFSPGMNQAGAGGTAGAGVHGMPVMGGVNSLGQHNFAGGIGPGQGQGQGQMLGSGQGVQGPMLGGGWGEYTS